MDKNSKIATLDVSLKPGLQCRKSTQYELSISHRPWRDTSVIISPINKRTHLTLKRQQNQSIIRTNNSSIACDESF